MLALSPHLDDAVFSAGGLLHLAARKGWRVVVATLFTGNVAQPSRFALACQLDKGLSPDVDYMALRREEDRQACAIVGAEPIHLPLLEAPHRGYGDAAALFAGVRPDDPARPRTTAAVQGLIDQLQPACVLGPLSIGHHVDHLIVRDAVSAVTDPRRVCWWEDWPYRDRDGPPSRQHARETPIDAALLKVKTRACAAYASQLGFQFGGPDGLKRKLAASGSEWLHAPTDDFLPRASTHNDRALAT